MEDITYSSHIYILYCGSRGMLERLFVNRGWGRGRRVVRNAHLQGILLTSACSLAVSRDKGDECRERVKRTKPCARTCLCENKSPKSVTMVLKPGKTEEEAVMES